jgi:L-galactose dehydrogenase
VAESVPVDTVLSYCRYNLMVQDLDRLLTPFLRERGIGLINASAFHMGLLTEAGPPAWHMAPKPVLETAARVAACCRANGAEVTTVALRFCMDHPYVSTTLAGMADEDQVRRNAAAADYEPDPELMRQIERIVAPVQDAIWPWGKPEYDDYESYRFPAERRN